MPDQPDDAPKRQRGVFPPFFAPRNGRGESSPTPPSGSWRRVSRLFTPPEGTRQRRTPAAPQAPYTPSPTPPATAAGTPPVLPAAEPPADASAEVGAGISEVEKAHFQADQEVPEAEPAQLDSLEIEPPYPPSPALAEAADDVARFDPMAFDEEMDRFVVESLEAEPITLAPSELERLDVEVDSLDTVVPDGGMALGENAIAASTPHDVIESIEHYLAEDVESYTAQDVESYTAEDVENYTAEAAAAASPAESTAPDDVAGTDDVFVAASEAAPVADLGAEPPEAVEADPWAGAELPEPAFGTIGWPSSEAAALAAEPPADDVDEMSAALAWNDAEGDGTPAGHSSFAAEANAGDASSDDAALSDVAHELRDSSSAWVAEGDPQAFDNADLSARARFYGGDPGVAPAELEVSGEGGDYASELEAAEAAGRAAAAAGDDAGAAIADALARVAARIRAGEVELPSEAVGASDESALAAALAALLRGPRR